MSGRTPYQSFAIIASEMRKYGEAGNWEKSAEIAAQMNTLLRSGKLPAPQAGLMASLASGIVGGQMPWGLIVMGMCFTLALILVKAPSPMLIAVGMYLPFETTFAIFVGGIFKWVFDKIVERRAWSAKEREAGENKGILLASGFIAGEAITGVLLAALVLLGVPSITQWLTGQEELAILPAFGGWLSIIVFAVVGIFLIGLPLKKAKA